jgi:hypothetical protein
MCSAGGKEAGSMPGAGSRACARVILVSATGEITLKVTVSGSLPASDQARAQITRFAQLYALPCPAR